MPRPATTKRFIISVESSSMEICIWFCDGLKPDIQARACRPGLRQQQREGNDVVAGDRLFAGKRVLRRHDNTHLIGKDVVHLNTLLVYRQLPKAEVGDVFHHGFDDSRAVGTVHLQLHSGETFLVCGKDGRQHVHASGFIGGDHEFARGEPLAVRRWCLARGASNPASARHIRQRACLRR